MEVGWQQEGDIYRGFNAFVKTSCEFTPSHSEERKRASLCARERASKSRMNHRKLSTPSLIRVTVFDAAYLIITDKMNHFHELVQCIEVYVSYRDVWNNSSLPVASCAIGVKRLQTWLTSYSAIETGH